MRRPNFAGLMLTRHAASAESARTAFYEERKIKATAHIAASAQTSA